MQLLYWLLCRGHIFSRYKPPLNSFGYRKVERVYREGTLWLDKVTGCLKRKFAGSFLFCRKRTSLLEISLSGWHAAKPQSCPLIAATAYATTENVGARGMSSR